MLESYEGLRRAIPLDDDRGGYLLVGRGGAHVRLSESAFHLLQAVRSGLSFEALAEKLGRRGSGEVSPQQVERCYRRIVERLEGIEREPRERHLPPGFWGRRRLLSEAAVARLVGPLTHLFRPAAAVAALVAIAAACAGLLAGEGDVTAWSGGDLAWAYLLFSLSLVAHELGHAAACARFGARPGEIGFTLYLVFPALYSDVTRAWRLARRQRLAVDLGGIYLQALFGTACLLGHRLTGWQPLETAFVMVLVASLVSLNPFFRLDGYWALSDLLGIDRLGSQPLRLARRLRDRLLGRRREPLPFSPRVSAVLALYAPLSLAAWGLFLARLLGVLQHRCTELPRQLAGFAEAGAGLELATSAFVLFTGAWLVWRLAARASVALAGLREA